MIFLLVRIFPYIIPVAYFALSKSLFYMEDYWPLSVISVVALLAIWFFLLKRRNPGKNLLLLFLYGAIYALAGLAYLTILENFWIINLFLIAWSFIFCLYLESVFHDFYDTHKTYILNLQNITLYVNILIVFFMTAALVNFGIFLNWPWYLILLFLFFIYLLLSYLTFLRQGLEAKKSQVFAAVLSLIMIQLIGAMILWPVSFYVIAILSALTYYLLSSISLAWVNRTLDNKTVIKYLVFSGVLAIVVLVSARWF